MTHKYYNIDSSQKKMYFIAIASLKINSFVSDETKETERYWMNTNNEVNGALYHRCISPIPAPPPQFV